MRSAEKPLRWTLHALYRTNRRSIDLDEARLAVSEPEFVIAGAAERRIHMRRYTEPETGRTMLIRAVSGPC
jgi:hypothetical protein